MSITDNFSMDTVLKRLNEDTIIPTNRESIGKHDLIISAKGIKESRRKRYIDVLRYWSNLMNKDFRKASKDDLIKAVDKLNHSQLADSTKELYKAILKTFYKWLEGNDEIFPEKIRWLKPKVHAASNKLPQDVFDEKDIQTMLSKTDDARDQAIIAVLYESGARAEEFLSLRLKDMQNETHGIRIRLDGKTGERSILLVSSIPYIVRYLNIHPDKENRDSPIWYARMNGRVQPLSYSGLKAILRIVGQRAGITKP
ncbi:MAG: tyrosine-type recombinase/integrase, partial [Candidatus Micrarchaeia archaeon]